MRTCWVLDHPAHVRLLTGQLQTSKTRDIIVATRRPEVEKMLATSEGILPRREIIWVERPVGKAKRRKALQRLRTVKKVFKDALRNGMPVQRVVSIGAPLEHWAHASIRKHRGSSYERWYISDTEINHLAHTLAKKYATDVVIPTHWDSSLDGGFEASVGCRIHRIDGLHGHIHLKPQLKSKHVRNPPHILVRRLLGDGHHDEDEIIPLPSTAWDGCDVTFVDEEHGIEDPWKLDSMLSSSDGVITQSVTMASEAVILGTPTLLVSRAKRGFLDRLERDGAPLFRWQKPCEGDEWLNLKAQFLAGIHLTDALEEMPWPEALNQFNALFTADVEEQTTQHQ
ncbi:MAG: hypothetical protein VW230_07785 [Candidatus Poseidoniales archaeon]